ncbi:hypothetical protein [Bradyrhizobium sp. Leo170]|uniref:hypothetical protein n=1 Tax=Bradyrhizobium sp. Leo170 TaxID=1571199 RepID=UPI00102E2DEA|nr:hypothetical protein [Bradyrhizobium sp. Leo170]
MSALPNIPRRCGRFLAAKLHPTGAIVNMSQSQRDLRFPLVRIAVRHAIQAETTIGRQQWEESHGQSVQASRHCGSHVLHGRFRPSPLIFQDLS